MERARERKKERKKVNILKENGERKRKKEERG
jgi:hypothetical protein